jgi:ABC-type multidrug transport system fused ATPase/permease subunit
MSLVPQSVSESLAAHATSASNEGLRYLIRGRTTFVIAHRLSTVRQADQILVLDAGQLVE